MENDITSRLLLDWLRICVQQAYKEAAERSNLKLADGSLVETSQSLHLQQRLLQQLAQALGQSCSFRAVMQNTQWPAWIE